MKVFTVAEQTNSLNDRVKVKGKAGKAVRGTPSHRYGVSLALPYGIT